MIVKTYRLKPFQENLIHGGQFYDSKYLQLNFLNPVDDELSQMDIAIAQLNEAHRFLKTRIQKNVTDRLNQDLMLQTFINEYNSEDNIVNEIWERIENLYNTGVEVQKKATKTILKEQSRICEDLLRQYAYILNLIEKSAQDKDNIIHSNILLTRLNSFKEQFEEFESSLLNNPETALKKLVGKNGYLNQLYLYDRMLKGYILEEDVVNKSKNFIFSDLKIAEQQPFISLGTGTLFVEGKMASVDTLLFKRSQLNEKIMISFKKVPPGEESKNYQLITMSLGQFIETMEKERGVWNFFIDQSNYDILCKQSIAAIQAKASRPKASIKFKSKTDWSTFSNKFAGIETKVLYEMYRLYHLSAELPKGGKDKDNHPIYDGKSWYKQKTTQYAVLANKALARNFQFIVGDNVNFILTNERGLETAGEFILRKIRDGWFFRWQNNYAYKTLDISRLLDLKYEIRLSLQHE